jgi:hypothetical protein
MSRRGWLGAALASAAIAGVLLAALLPREWGTSGEATPVLVVTQKIAGGVVVLTASDVKEAFADQGLSLEEVHILRGVPALHYPAGSDGKPQRIVCMVFSRPATARTYVKIIHEKRPGNIARALLAKNVAVLLDPAATRDDVRRTLRAVAELRHQP